DGLEELDEVCARHRLRAERAHQLNRARVNARDVGDGVFGRVLHRYARLARRADGRERVAQVFVKLAPTAVDQPSSGQTVELALLDGVVDAHGFALGGYEVEPATRRELARVELQYSVGERVALPEVVEEPAVEARFAKRRLNVADALGACVAVVRVVACRCHVVRVPFAVLL